MGNVNGNFSISKIMKYFVFVVLIFYAVGTLISQQNQLHSMEKYKADLSRKIEHEQQRTKQLIEDKQAHNSDAFMEKIARDKLGYVKDNERIFIDGAGR